MTGPARKDRPVASPIYQRIAKQLRERIADGTYGPGDQLPTERELMTEFKIARGTAREAVHLLVQEGLVTTRRALGAFVRARRPMLFRPQGEFEPAPSAEMDRFMAQITAEGRAPAQTIDVAVIPPPRYVAEKFASDADVVVVRRRTRSIDGEPYNICDSYFPFDLVRGSEIMLPTDIARGANEVLAELDARQDRVIDEWHFRQPTPDETRRLELLPGTAVGVCWATGYDTAGRPVRCVYNVLPGDRHVVVYERIRPAE